MKKKECNYKVISFLTEQLKFDKMNHNWRKSMKKQRQILWIGRYTFIALSCIWGIIALCGFVTFGWISRLTHLTPAELVVQVSALSFPICFFYLLGAYIDRNRMTELNSEAAKDYLEELVYPSELGAQHVQDLNNELKQQIQIFRSSFSDVTTQTNQVREDLENWVDDLNKIILHMDEQTKKMAGFVKLLNEAGQEASEKSAAAGQNLAAQADILMKVAEQTQQHLSNTTKELVNQTEEMTQNVHAVNQAEKNISQSLDKSAAWISKLSDNAQQIEKSMKTTAVMQGFLNDTDKVLLRFKEIGTTLDMRLKDLKANKNDKAIKPAEAVPVFSAKDFTKCMQQILDTLQGLSVEMMSVFSMKNEESLWDQYYAGDKAVFMRHIRMMISNAKKQKILDLAEGNQSFKENVMLYMKTFEDLTRGLENSPWLGVLVGSDPGRLYMVLATLFKGDKDASKVG